MFKKAVLFVVTMGFIFSAVAAWAGKSGSTEASMPVRTDIERLGMKLFKDKNLSFNGTQSCQNCHHPFAGFADITNSKFPESKVVSIGADGVSAGTRNAPSAAYAGYSPILNNDETGEWEGGMFWDGRATGEVLGDPLAEQAQGPPLNEVEMNMPSITAIIEVIRQADYVDLWNKVFGRGSLNDEIEAYDNFGRAIAAYERSGDVTAFTSKYDVAPDSFTDDENQGLGLFETHCSACHSVKPDFGSPSPLFTNYKYANIGVPANPDVALDDPDLGLGPVVNDPEQDGKFKVPTLRNIALSAPYSHNGYFPTLEQMVAFINNRGDLDPDVDSTLDPRVGNLGLSNDDVGYIVSFLKTLTDGY